MVNSQSPLWDLTLGLMATDRNSVKAKEGSFLVQVHIVITAFKISCKYSPQGMYIDEIYMEAACH